MNMVVQLEFTPHKTPELMLSRARQTKSKMTGEHHYLMSMVS